MEAVQDFLNAMERIGKMGIERDALLAACKILNEHLGHYIHIYAHLYPNASSVSNMRKGYNKMQAAIAKAEEIT